MVLELLPSYALLSGSPLHSRTHRSGSGTEDRGQGPGNHPRLRHPRQGSNSYQVNPHPLIGEFPMGNRGWGPVAISNLNE